MTGINFEQRPVAGAGFSSLKREPPSRGKSDRAGGVGDGQPSPSDRTTAGGLLVAAAAGRRPAQRGVRPAHTPPPGVGTAFTQGRASPRRDKRNPQLRPARPGTADHREAAGRAPPLARRHSNRPPARTHAPVTAARGGRAPAGRAARPRPAGGRPRVRRGRARGRLWAAGPAPLRLAGGRRELRSLPSALPEVGRVGGCLRRLWWDAVSRPRGASGGSWAACGEEVGRTAPRSPAPGPASRQSGGDGVRARRREAGFPGDLGTAFLVAANRGAAGTSPGCKTIAAGDLKIIK